MFNKMFDNVLGFYKSLDMINFYFMSDFKEKRYIRKIFFLDKKFTLVTFNDLLGHTSCYEIFLSS